MQLLDWIVLVGTTLFIILYGLWKSRKSNHNMEEYLRSSHSMPWYVISLSVISTQASAITFVSAPGQGYSDGMRFILFYLGLPLAMIVVSAVFLPIYYRLNVITAYEYLETKFNVKVRVLTSFFFLIQRGLSAAISIAAPAIVLSVILDWNIYLTNLFLGGVVAVYTILGGSDAVSQTQKLQMLIILIGMAVAGYLVVALMPTEVAFVDAVRVAGKTGKLNTMDFTFNWNNQYNLWTGLIGGFFLQMAYFGTDQSQVGRYLGGSSLTQSRLGLLFNGIFKIPMQFCILFIGVMLFVFYQFNQPPIFFNKAEVEKIAKSEYAGEFKNLEKSYQQVFEEKKIKTQALILAMRNKDSIQIQTAEKDFKLTESKFKDIKKETLALMKKNDSNANTNDANYIFLSFVTKYLPAGLIGLLIVAILFASMSTTASELNALASTSVVDIYKRTIYTTGSEKHYLLASKVLTLVWAAFAIAVAQFSVQLGTLIEVVNMLGSWFYGTILGIFALALFFKNINSSAVFVAAILSEIFVISLALGTSVAYLWLNMIGCVAVIVFSLLGTLIARLNDRIA